MGESGSESHWARHGLPLNPPLSAELPASSLRLTPASLHATPSWVLERVLAGLLCGSDPGPNFFVYRISTHLSGFGPPLAITGTAIPEISQRSKAGFTSWLPAWQAVWCQLSLSAPSISNCPSAIWLPKLTDISQGSCIPYCCRPSCSLLPQSFMCNP